MIWIIVGFICFLLFLGALFTGSPISFAIKSIVLLGAIAFISFIALIIWIVSESNKASEIQVDMQSQATQPYIDKLNLPISSDIIELPISFLLPSSIGQCTKTTVAKVGNRLEGVPDSGSFIKYNNNGVQVSYENIKGIENSLIGDEVYLCLIYIPTDCPVGDFRGKVYSALNLRTGYSWEAQDSAHSCGGV
jgi:hypothetical protein